MSDNKLVPMSDVQALAQAAVSSRFFPGVQSPEQALVLMAIAQAEGMAPIQAMQRYDVIQGRPAKKAQTMLSDFLLAGGKVQWHEHSDKVAEATFSHPQGGEIRVRWDIEKARNAGLLGKDNWKRHPEAMLHARCVSNGVRFVYPAATGGMYDPTEVADFDIKPPSTIRPQWGKLAEPAQDVPFQEVEESPLPSILQAISLAETMDQLKAIKPRVADLSGKDRQDAIEAYKARGEDLQREEELAKMPAPQTEVKS